MHIRSDFKKARSSKKYPHNDVHCRATILVVKLLFGNYFFKAKTCNILFTIFSKIKVAEEFFYFFKNNKPENVTQLNKYFHLHFSLFRIQCKTVYFIFVLNKFLEKKLYCIFGLLAPGTKN